MDPNNKFNPEAFSQYLKTIVNIQSLQNITENLDKELKDSQNVLNEIRSLFNSIPRQQTQSSHGNNELTQEHLSQFLAAGDPKLLMPDMPENTGDINLDNVIASMKNYAEDLRKNFVLPEPKQEHVHREIKNLNLEEYATNLDMLAKQLGNIALNKQNLKNRDVELEEKLSQLCEDVNNFTKMVQVKSKLGVTNTNWIPTQQDDTALYYDNQINKLLLSIHEITYLLKNKN